MSILLQIVRISEQMDKETRPHKRRQHLAVLRQLQSQLEQRGE